MKTPEEYKVWLKKFSKNWNIAVGAIIIVVVMAVLIHSMLK